MTINVTTTQKSDQSHIPMRTQRTIASSALDEQRLLIDAFKIVKSAGDEAGVLNGLLELLLKVDGVIRVGVANYANSEWQVSKISAVKKSSLNVITSETAKLLCVIDAKLQDTLSVCYQRNSILQMNYPMDGLEAIVLAVPIAVVGSDPEVLIVVSNEKGNQVTLRHGVEHVATALQFWRQSCVSRANDWKIASLSAVIDLSDRIEASDGFRKACIVLVNELAQYVDCSNVAIGWIRKKKLRLEAVSSSSCNVGRSDLDAAIEQTLQETVIRGTPGVWVVDDQADKALLLMHKSLGHALKVECVRSWPIRNADGEILGAWLFADTKLHLLTDRFERFIDVSTPRIGSALRLSYGNQIGLVKRFCKARLAWLGSRTVWFGIAGFATIASLLCIPVSYQVKAAVEVVPEWRRFVVAPFDGQIERAFARVGDYVQAGQTIAILDGRHLDWQLLSLRAEKEKAMRKREVELASRNAAEALLAEQEVKRITAEEAMLEDRLEQLSIKAPMAGVVLSGTSQRAEASSVVIGQPVFEIGSTNPIRLELAIPADDVTSIQGQANVRVWLQGEEQNMIHVKLDRVRPRSEDRLGRNVFIGEISLDNANGVLRPGMTGVAKVECEKSPLAWNLFHKPWNYIRTLMIW